MMTVPHMLIGAAIGSAVQHLPAAPELAFGLGLVSHYVADSLPHWERLFNRNDLPGFTTHARVSSWPRTILVQAVADVLLAVSIIALVLFAKGHLGTFWHSPIFWGALGGVFPDLLDNLPFWNQITGKLPILKYEQHIHESLHITQDGQRKAAPYAGLVTQLIAVAASIVVLSITK